MSYFGLEGLEKRYIISQQLFLCPQISTVDAGEIMMTEAPPWKKLKLGSHQNPDQDMQEFSGTAKVFLKRTFLCKSNKLQSNCKYLFFNITLDTMIMVWLESARLFQIFKLVIDKIFKDRQEKHCLHRLIWVNTNKFQLNCGDY